MRNEAKLIVRVQGTKVLVRSSDDQLAETLKNQEHALNEVRMLCQSILFHGSVLTADKTIRYAPEASILKLRLGDPIRSMSPGSAPF
jgi:hypothetical protein